MGNRINSKALRKKAHSWWLTSSQVISTKYLIPSNILPKVNFLSSAIHHGASLFSRSRLRRSLGKTKVEMTYSAFLLSGPNSESKQLRAKKTRTLQKLAKQTDSSNLQLNFRYRGSQSFLCLTYRLLISKNSHPGYDILESNVISFWPGP